MMDNQSIDITSEGDAGIGLALAIIWDRACPGSKATHYKVVRVEKTTRYYGRVSDAQDPRIHGTVNARPVAENVDGLPGIHVTHHSSEAEASEGVETLILLWSEERGATKLPFPLDRDQAADFLRGWMKQADYGPQPDHDGDNGAGWRMFTDHWGHVAGHHYAIVGVQPAWAMYGK